MAQVNALNVSNLLAFAAEYAPDVIESLLQELEVNSHFNIDTSVTNAKRYPKMSIGNVLGPYTGSIDTTGNEITLSDRELRVDVGQAVIAIESEIARRTFLGKKSNITDGNVPMEEAFLRYYVAKIFQQFNSETFYKGDKSLADNAGNKSKRMMDGLEKDILAAITATEIVPVTTAAFSSGTGWNSTFVDGNTIQGVEATWEGLRAPYRMNNSKAFVSESVFKKLCEQHNRRYQTKVDYIDASKTSFYLDGTGEKLLVQKAFWLGASQRVICANDGAIQVGTDKANMISELEIQRIGFNWIYMSKFVAGVRTIDTEAISVNSLA